MKARLIIASALAITAFAVAGCGEKPNVTIYKQGQYQGKPDNVPWQSQPFNNSQADWDKAIKARNARQNEYARIENQ
ncbi:MAG: hypothetical protein JWN13_260 [Betaproteobacteria bacterium]|jgi:hypothetical protein|nr:hypothetical protein [Betaproteobacteria bacterium]